MLYFNCVVAVCSLCLFPILAVVCGLCVWHFLDMRGSRGGRETGVRIPLKTHKNIGFLSNIGLDPLKNHKATNPAFNVGPSSARQRNGVLLAGR